MINFDSISNTNRIPLFQAEFNNSMAVTGTPPQRQCVLLFGQRSSSVGGVINVPYRITRAEQAAERWGRGSMIARMVAEFIAINPDTELYAIAQDNGTGKNDAGTITMSGTSVVDGVLSIYIAGKGYPVAVSKGEKAADVAGKLALLINQDLDAPVAAVANAPSDNSDATKKVIALSAKFVSECDHDVRLNYYPEDVTPLGITVIISGRSAVPKNPDITRSVAAMGDRQYNYIVMPYKDAANLKILANELLTRWGPEKMNDGMVWMAHTGTFGNVSSFGESRNDFLFTCTAIPKAPEPDYIWAATLCATCAPSLSVDPARPLQSLALPSRLAPALSARLTREERNSLLYTGISTVTVGAGDVMQIERQVTMYRQNAYGESDPSYLDVETIYTLSYLRYSLRVFITQRFPRHKLADDGTPVGPGQFIVTPQIMKLQLIALGEEWIEQGLVENMEVFKNNLLVERNATDRNRLDVMCTPDLVNQFRFMAAQIRFIL
ncbi:phage tail sheath subtilisin-like domain-containing protein [Escherichia coli]|nr:phage tail protein [Escherichia coli]EEQ7999745.1 phage tail protein [Escherichia coli]EEQ8118369.1 phage tail protein [Escherichia coli]EEQ8179790.1 phage tail protein [Escherichia coli]EFE2643726.1 phage tail protein [Escherichia coli]